jgi:glycosyltransferase involved in cell wall biosynthesis
MARGNAIVATEVGGLAEILTHHSNALLVPPCDSLGLGDALRALLERPALRASLGSQAAADSVRYDADAAVRDMEDLYERLMIPSSALLEAGAR